MQPNSKSSSGPVILWFRRDLRLDDNHALAAAVSEGRPVVPLFIRETGNTMALPYGGAQAWWLHHSLQALAAAMETCGNRLTLRTGRAAAILDALVRETGARAIHWNRRHDPEGISVDSAIKADFTERGIAVRSFPGQLLHHPTRLKTKSGGPYKVYTPFWRALEAQGEPDTPIDAPERIAPPERFPKGERLEDWSLLPAKPDWASRFQDLWTPGERAAREKLSDFADDPIHDYRTARDIPAKDGTSLLSPHLAFGEISPARIWHETRGRGPDGNGVITFRKELAWRDFCHHLLFHNPDMARTNIDRRFDAFAWRDDEKSFKAWTRGETGYPIVDAGMRQLWRHGTMHNRVRMVAASFLIKHLLIDWRKGEAWFRDTLVDADPASNAANWQWVAGCGADAAPFFRIFNPILQGEKFDPHGAYVKTHIPELSDLPDKYIHCPFEAPVAILEKAGIDLGSTYPRPLVDHSLARKRAMDAFNAIKDRA